jgi:hypothetical protein
MGTHVSEELGANIFRAKSKLKMEAADSTEILYISTRLHVATFQNIIILA